MCIGYVLGWGGGGYLIMRVLKGKQHRRPHWCHVAEEEAEDETREHALQIVQADGLALPQWRGSLGACMRPAAR